MKVKQREESHAGTAPLRHINYKQTIPGKRNIDEFPKTKGSIQFANTSTYFPPPTAEKRNLSQKPNPQGLQTGKSVSRCSVKTEGEAAEGWPGDSGAAE